MTACVEHRGIIIAIPANADGKWRWELSTRSYRGTRYFLPSPIPRPTYRSQQEALAGAKAAIDEFRGDGVIGAKTIDAELNGAHHVKRGPRPSRVAELKS